MLDRWASAPRELHGSVAVACLTGVIVCVLVAGFGQLGVANCPTCTTYSFGGGLDCNYQELTYCGGGLPLLAVFIAILTVLSILFGASAAFKRKRDAAGRFLLTTTPRSLPLSAKVQAFGLAILCEGSALSGMGLTMGLASEGSCENYCPLSIPLSGIPSGLVIVGSLMAAMGALCLVVDFLEAAAEEGAQS